MARYIVPNATEIAQDLPVPTSRAMLQPMGGAIVIGVPPLTKDTGWVVFAGVGFVLEAGESFQYMRASKIGHDDGIRVNMMDKE